MYVEKLIDSVTWQVKEWSMYTEMTIQHQDGHIDTMELDKEHTVGELAWYFDSGDEVGIALLALIKFHCKRSCFDR